MGLARLYTCTKFEVSSFIRSMQIYGACAMQWLVARGGVPKLARGSLFFIGPTKSGINIVNALR